MRLGLFGGTFDPPHVGHLLAAVDAFEALELDALVYIPAATQPLKAGLVAAEPEDRLRMVELLVQGDPRFAVDPIEIRRQGLSYTVDTLAAYAASAPGARRFLLVGADVPAAFEQWRDPERILQLAEVVVLRRRTEAAGNAAGDAQAARWGFRTLETRQVDVSSTEIRARVAAGRSIRGFVPEAVAEYIRSAGLYR
ncbi:MAG TPA: nicotinate-nucleotide adenylyltransferase [Gemmatimonadaceae bacterium]|nr:nicotinate-nucleotide adenylyltransferase [Gemmatimonadaceae bacterium]